MLAWQMLDLTESNGTTIDLLIGLKFPAYLVNHPNKVLWIIHQHRQAYDLWNTQFDDLSREPDGPRVRDIIVEADNRFIPEARRVFANSQTVADRLKRFNNVNATPLYHPPPNTELFECKAYRDFVFCPSLLDPTKRPSLLIEAMSRTESDVNCIIAGTGPLKEDLRKKISALGLRDRVTLVGNVTDRQLADYYANARAVFFGPFHEDYGYVTLEALYSKKCVITLADSGGPLEFIEPGVNGLVVSPRADEIAAAIDLLSKDKQLAQTMGERGFDMLQSRHISWASVVSALLS